MTDKAIRTKKGKFMPQLLEVSSRSSDQPISTVPRSSSKSSGDKGQFRMETPETTIAGSIDDLVSSSGRDTKLIDASSQITITELPQLTQTTMPNNNSLSKNHSPKRKFAPEPFEVSTRSSAQSSQSGSGGKDDASKPARLIGPQLVESSSGSGFAFSSGNKDRKPKDALEIAPSNPEENSRPYSFRRFVPQLVETEKRSFRQKDSNHHLPSRVRSNVSLAAADDSSFSYANLVRRRENRSHSYRVPELPVIQSNSSDESVKSAVQSRSLSPSSPSPDEFEMNIQHQNSNTNALTDENSEPLLSLAVRTVERKLKDQALAAFPNEQVYQPVAHFAIDREDTDDDDEKTDAVLRGMQTNGRAFRRESTINLGWELEEMRRHKEEAEARARENTLNMGESKFSAAAIAARRAEKLDLVEDDTDMKEATSPPMLGADIVLPRSLSPITTRCDLDNSSAPYRNTVEELPEPSDAPLWTANIKVHDETPGGLWMGTCKKSENPKQNLQTTARTGIITPAVTPERGPFHNSNDVFLTTSALQMPSSPPTSNPDLTDMDKMLLREQDIEREFHDGFVTQIYNYLSLGYPCLARDYDEELSKISHISVEDLRKDDCRANAKGYLGFPAGIRTSVDATTGGKCVRWTALKLYIHEWARQQPIMHGSISSLEGWGFRARRGSWAF